MNKNDLTQGVIWKKLVLYFLPLAAGTIFQQLYNAVDGIVVSKFVGTTALAAVGGSAAQIFGALVNFFVALTSGGSVLIAQYFGANNSRALRKSTHTSLSFSAIVGIVITIFGFAFTPDMLVIMKTPDDSMAEAILYLRIVFSGVLFQIVYNMAAGILRAVGDSKSSFIYVAVSCTVNIVLDILAVKTLHMGVAGAGYATVISQALCCGLAVAKLIKLKDEDFGLRIKEIAIEWRSLKRVLALGTPLAMQSLMYSITNLMIQVKINSLGTVVVASWALTSRIDGFFWGFMTAAGVTISNFISQNYGKGDIERMDKGVKASFIIFMIVGGSFSAFVLSFGTRFIPIFSSDPLVIDCTWQIMLYFVPYYPIWVVNEVLSGALRGEGKTLPAFIITACSICIFRVIWLYTLFAMYPTLFCVSMAYPVSWTLCDVIMIIYYIYHIKHRNMVK